MQVPVTVERLQSAKSCQASPGDGVISSPQILNFELETHMQAALGEVFLVSDSAAEAAHHSLEADGESTFSTRPHQTRSDLIISKVYLLYIKKIIT